MARTWTKHRERFHDYSFVYLCHVFRASRPKAYTYRFKIADHNPYPAFRCGKQIRRFEWRIATVYVGWRALHNITKTWLPPPAVAHATQRINTDFRAATLANSRLKTTGSVGLKNRPTLHRPMRIGLHRRALNRYRLVWKSPDLPYQTPKKSSS